MTAITPVAFIDIASQHPGRFIGPQVAGAMVQALEAGVVVAQSTRFWSTSTDHHVFVKSIVIFVSIVATCHVAMSLYNVWRIMVLDLGDWQAVFAVRWPVKLHPAMTGLMATPVQAFLIWRCYNVMRRRRSVLIVLSLLLLLTIIAIVLITIRMFVYDVAFATINSKKRPLGFIAAYFLSAMLDMVITVIMMWFLFDIKTQVTTPRADRVIARLLRMMWEAAAPPCLCAIMACILYMKMAPQNWWTLFCQNILGMLYVMSLLATLNGRAELKRLSIVTVDPLFLTPSSISMFQSGLSSPSEHRAHISTVARREDVKCCQRVGPVQRDETSLTSFPAYDQRYGVDKSSNTDDLAHDIV